MKLVNTKIVSGGIWGLVGEIYKNLDRSNQEPFAKTMEGLKANRQQPLTMTTVLMVAKQYGYRPEYEVK